MADDIIQRLAEKRITKEELLKEAEADPGMVPRLVEGLSSQKPAIRYGCSRVLMDLSALHPEWLYPHWDAFVDLLGGKYRPLTWGAVATIANLTGVDAGGRFEAAFERYYSLMGDGYLVTAANVVGSSAKIAMAKPHLADRIAERLLAVEGIEAAPHMTEECKRVVAEHAVAALRSFYDLLSPRMKEGVIAFMKRQRTSSRKSLAEAAEEFLARVEGLNPSASSTRGRAKRG